MRFPPVADAPRRARGLLRRELTAAGLAEHDDLTDSVVLLASELFDNAVLHAGTEFEVEMQTRPDSVTVAVSDHGAGPLERHLAQPRQGFGRAAEHGRGLILVERLATAWGTRHDSDGTHTIWFTLHHRPPARCPAPTVPQPVPVGPVPKWPDPDQVRRLLHIPAEVGERLGANALVAELTRRLREIFAPDGAGGVEGVTVEVDHGDGNGMHKLTRDGRDPATQVAPHRVIDVPLPLTAPQRGRLRVALGPDTTSARSITEVAELAAYRIALAVESDWLRGADRSRRAWMTYLADTSQLLGQSLDVELTVTVIPQIVVPRLGAWCAVHLLGPTRELALAALTHADEDTIVELRAALDPARSGALCARLAELTDPTAATTDPAWISRPTDAIAVPLVAAGRPIGVLTVGRPTNRPHTPEDVVLITDIARRSALAIDNAQRTARHVATSQALQQALLPRALPAAEGVEFAAEYLPASVGSDVGGDFYDVITLVSGHWLAAIGDVCGKGATAAARTGLVRDVLRVLARDGRPLTSALELLNDVMMEAHDPSQFCTLAAAEVRRAGPGVTGRTAGLFVDLVLAGHERPVLVRASGAAELVGTYGTALGLVNRVQLRHTRLHLAPGDALLAYTDGVTEHRDADEFYGADRLVATVSSIGGASAARLVGGVRAAIEAFSRTERRDDVALLAVAATERGAQSPSRSPSVSR
ncbi:SpoIIE family protein phosphatase [Pseudonocardia hispaniensis]|uniref:SpoIIE family protein phosphatase n=1 Tax=Pseudonocardia hispaniensis TaxID=904933 RepID=A0ABW1J095_9PSEU